MRGYILNALVRHVCMSVCRLFRAWRPIWMETAADYLWYYAAPLW